MKPILPLLAEKGGACRWLVGAAPSGWEQPGFNDAAWKETGAPLGSALGAGTPVSMKGAPVLARRVFTLEEAPKSAVLRIDGWAQFTVWINGRRALEISNGRTEHYVPATLVRLPPGALGALQAGRNVLAVEASASSGRLRRQTAADDLDYFDTALYGPAPPP
jgi:hypothetical protein